MSDSAVPRFYGIDVMHGEHGEGGWVLGEDNPGGEIDFGPCVRASDYDALLAKVTELEHDVSEWSSAALDYQRQIKEQAVIIERLTHELDVALRPYPSKQEPSGAALRPKV